MASAWRTARSTGFVVGLTIAVLVAAGAMLTIVHSNSAVKQQQLVVSNYDIISVMRRALLALQDAELGQRAYLLTGNAANLDTYERARLRIDTLVRQLEAAAASDPDARRQIAEFKVAAGEKLDELNSTVVAFQLYGRNAALDQSAGRVTTDHIRQVAESFVEGEQLQLARRLATLRSEQQQADVAGLLVLGGAFVCLIAGMLVIVRGAGRLEDAQRLLSARSHLLQATLETLQDPIFVLDAQGVVVAWNGSFVRLAGWDPVKQPLPTRDRLLSGQWPTIRPLLAPLKLAQGTVGGLLVARVAHDGQEYEVSRGDMPDGGAVIRCVDVTDKLRDEAALRQGQKMEAIGQLTGGMAHDFNNILQVIQANLDLVKDDVGSNREAIGRLHNAGAAAERGARLTQQLLAFARRQPLAPQPTNVARLVSELAELLRHAMDERITLNFAIAEDAWNAKIDPGQLENAILNLAINARDAMPDGGSVRIEVSNATLDRRYAALHPEVTPGPYVQIAVEDTGTGMPAEIVAHAFDPFFTTKAEGKGTGLGLSMVYGFVHQSSGHIRIDSAIGQGTSVKLYLPRTLDPVPESPAGPTAALTGRERVLVVEDNDDVRQAVVDMLAGWGYRVVAAENPDVAARLLEKDRAFDLLFTDVVMPGATSAVELAERAQRLRPGIAVLLTSGYARNLISPQDRLDYPMIAKPYRGDELAAKIHAVLAARRSYAPVAPTETKAAAPLRDRPRRVLVVEDEVVLRLSTVDMLERLNCSVAAVGSGEQALEVLSKDPSFDLMLTDLGLPGMGGEALAAEVHRRFPALPVVIASGYGRTAGQGDGVQFISKPYSSVDLEQALDHAARTAVVS